MSAKRRPRVPPNVWKGALAGLAGGLAGAAAKALVDKLLPPGKPPLPALELAARVGVPPTRPEVITTGTHLATSLLAGLAYGVAVEFKPEAKAWGGATFGLALNRILRMQVLPDLKVAAPPAEQPAAEKLSQWVGHATFGVATESVRRAVRKGL